MRRPNRKRTNRNIPAKGRLRDMADSLWALAVKVDWNHACAVCGVRQVESHHLVPRQHEATRYELRNGIALCPQHHQFDVDMSPHQNAAGWVIWLDDHQRELGDWVFDHCRPRFYGTKTVAYYIGHIRRLRDYVEPADFDRIVGVRFSAYLDSMDEEEK